VCAASRSCEGTGERPYRPVLALFADFSPRRGDAGPFADAGPDFRH
jgi:hypothetical protein